MTHQTASLEKYWKLFPTTLKRYESCRFEVKSTQPGSQICFNRSLLVDHYYVEIKKDTNLLNKLVTIS